MVWRWVWGAAGDYNEKGGFLKTTPGGNNCKGKERNEIPRPGGNGVGAQPASPPRRPEGSGGTELGTTERGTGRGAAAASPSPAVAGEAGGLQQILAFVIKNKPPLPWELSSLPRQQAPAAPHRGMLDVGRRAGGPRPLLLASPPVPQRVPPSPPRGCPGSALLGKVRGGRSRLADRCTSCRRMPSARSPPAPPRPLCFVPGAKRTFPSRLPPRRTPKGHRHRGPPLSCPRDRSPALGAVDPPGTAGVVPRARRSIPRAPRPRRLPPLPRALP